MIRRAVGLAAIGIGSVAAFGAAREIEAQPFPARAMRIMSTALFCSLAGLSMVHVPFKGMAPALNDLIAGHVSLTIGVIAPTLPHVTSGRLRGLAITSTHRSEIVPELPTIAEAALPGYAASAWFGLLAPARTPEAVISRLNAEIVRVLQLADVKERLAAQGADLQPNTPDELGRHIRTEIDKWAKVIKDVGIRAE